MNNSAASAPTANSPAATRRKAIDVAVGILMRDDGTLLLARRPEGKPYAGYWEFPGGKLEAGESAYQALCREFLEETGVVIERAYAWCGVQYDYPHANVRLHFFICRQWRGDPAALEQQTLAWQGMVEVAPILPATIPLLQWLEPLRENPAERVDRELESPAV